MGKMLSVIMPVYNAETVLPETLERLIGQSFRARFPGGMEIIAVDDASGDESRRILQEARDRDPDLIRLIELTENKGPGGARNAALEAAEGEYIGMIDADDLPDLTMYEKLWDASFFASDGEDPADRYDVVDCGIYNQAEDAAFHYTPQDLCGRLDDKARAELIAEAGCPVTRIYRRDLLQEYRIRFREHVITMEDQDFLCEVFARAGSVNAVQEILYAYRDTPDSATKRGAETTFFEETVRSVMATYERLSVLPNYPGIRPGAEYFYLYQCLLAQSVIDAYRQEGVVTEDFAGQMTGLLRQVVTKTVRIKATDNPLLVRKLGGSQASRIEEVLQQAGKTEGTGDQS